MVVGVRVAVGAVGVGLVIISHISDHFVMRMVVVRVVKQFKERVKSAKRKDLNFRISIQIILGAERRKRYKPLQPCELWEIDTRLDHDRQIDPSQIGDIDRVQNHICTIHGRPEAVRQYSLFQSSDSATYFNLRQGLEV